MLKTFSTAILILGIPGEVYNVKMIATVFWILHIWFLVFLDRFKRQ